MAKSTVQKPPMHRRRTSDELHKALAIVESHKDTLHVNADDEHVTVLADAVTELLATRQILIPLLQELDGAHNDATAKLMKIWQ